MTPSIGAIIISYNYARYVADAIESVLAQDPPFDDVVVVDDGSTDDSLAVIEAYKPRVRVIAKENGGQLSASLAGIAAVTTDYLYILDADDYIAPGFIGTAGAFLVARPAKVQFQLVGVDAKKNLLGATFPTYAKRYGAKQMVEDNCVIGFYVSPPTSANIYRRDVLTDMKLHLIDSREPLDGSPGLAMPYLGRVMAVNRPLGYYRVHGQNMFRWDQPDVSLFQSEIELFYRRWTDVCKLLGLDRPPFGDDEPLHVLERRLMQSALDPSRGVVRASGRYLRRLSAAHLPKRQKIMLMVWAIALLPPMATWRTKLVFARRSAVNRSAGLRRLIGLLTRQRVLAPELESESPRPYAPHR